MTTAVLTTRVAVPWSQDLAWVKKELTLTAKSTSVLGKAATLQMYEIIDDTLYMPKQFAIDNSTKLGISNIEDRQWSHTSLSTEETQLTLPHGLRPHQASAVDTIVDIFNSEPLGGGALLNLSCGMGKSVASLQISHRMGVKTLIIVNTAILANQWKNVIAQYVKGARVGMIQQAKFEVENMTHVVAVAHTVAGNRYDFSEAGFGLIIADECLPYNQLIQTEDGPVEIGKLYNNWKAKQTLPKVASLNEGSGAIEMKQILHAFEKINSRILEIKCSTSVLRCTANHQVLTTKGYIPARDLIIGDILTSNSPEKTVYVEKIIAIDNPSIGKSVYDLEVADNHNFIPCGDDGIGPVVHNCHRVCCVSLSKCLTKAGCRYRLGLSATLNRQDGFDHFLKCAIGDIGFQAVRENPDDLRVYSIHLDEGPTKMHIIRAKGKETPCMAKITNEMEGDSPRAMARQEVIAGWLRLCVSKERQCLVVADRISLLEGLAELLKADENITTAFLIGKTKAKDRDSARDANVILASYPCAAEGLDISSLDTLILATPRSGSNTITQCIGRTLRVGGKSPLVIDIVDKLGVLQGMYRKRCKVYREMNAVITDWDERNVKL